MMKSLFASLLLAAAAPAFGAPVDLVTLYKELEVLW
jgi:hypothetical protein